MAASDPPPGPSTAQSDPDGGFVASFELNDADITPAVRATLDEAIRKYRSTGNTMVRIAALQGDTGDPALSERRAIAISDYLERRGVWSRAVVRAPAGAWLPWSPASAASATFQVPTLLLGPRPIVNAVEPPTPPPPPSPPSPPRPPLGVRPPPGPNGQAMPPPTAAIDRPAPPMSAVRVWLTPTGTLTAEALAAMMAECVRFEGELTAECQSAAVAGVGGFGAAPQDARDEFSFLLDSCRGAAPDESCSDIIRLDREFRALRRGRLDPQPRTMREDERTRFTAFIIEDGNRRRQGGPGRPIGGETGDDKAAGGAGATDIPISRRMCFGLTADAKDFLIKPLGDPCMNILAGGGRIKFNPQWDVTPLRAGTLELRLVTELFVNNEKREFRHEPYPLPIKVEAKLSLWDRIDNVIRRATGTVNLAAGLAEAIGTLFTIIAGWAIWSLFRKRRRSRKTSAAKKE